MENKTFRPYGLHDQLQGFLAKIILLLAIRKYFDYKGSLTRQSRQVKDL